MFLYFFPGKVIVDPKRFPDHAATLETCGLTEVFRDASLSYREIVDRGPNGGGGSVVGFAGPTGGDTIGYYPDKQTWVEVKDANDVTTHWLGWETLPGPTELLRGKPIDGVSLVLSDGNSWLIPVVSGPRVSLPQSLSMSSKGELTGVVKAGFDGIIMSGQKWHEVFVTEGSTYGFSDAFNYIIELLSVNYRIGRQEANVLGVIPASQVSIEAIIYASLGAKEG